ncbi:hypothetical protein AAULR_25561 [Lacticaseibacillus rhamnosus MTCC 5462]|nr:hypothetical protein AAULR_25561 [Lacticaseibacillus rhamnosus MTCC 5462]
MKAAAVYATIIIPTLFMIIAVIRVNKQIIFRRQLMVQRSVYLLEVSLSCWIITTFFSGLSGLGWWLPVSHMSAADIFQTYFISFTVYQVFVYIWAKQRTSAEVDAYEAYLNWLNYMQIGEPDGSATTLTDQLEELSDRMLTDDIKEMIKVIKPLIGDSRIAKVIPVQQEYCRHAIATAELEWNQSLFLRILK